MKKTAIFTTLCIFAAIFAGCNQDVPEEGTVSADTESAQSSTVAADVALDDILTAIQDAYGENYLATSEMPVEILEAEFGLTADLYEEAKGMMPMIGTHNDCVVIVKAKAGQADQVEQALLAARQAKIDDTMQYPMNVPKTNAAQVVRNGDYVAFLLVGALGDFADPEGAEAQQYAQEQVQIAVDAFNSAFVA